MWEKLDMRILQRLALKFSELSFLRIRKKLNVVFVVVLVRENKGLIILILSFAFTANRFDAFKSQPHYNL